MQWGTIRIVQMLLLPESVLKISQVDLRSLQLLETPGQCSGLEESGQKINSPGVWDIFFLFLLFLKLLRSINQLRNIA